MTKPNLPTEKKLPTKAESLLAQASATVKKENERKSALTAAGVKDIAKYDSAYAPLKNFDKDITSLYTEINDLGRFYTATDKQLGSAKTNAQKMKNRIGQINSFLDTYGNLYDENTIKAMRSDLADIDSTLTDWLGKASADDYLEKLNSPASGDTTSVATAIRDKESEKARAERGGRDTTEISNELNALYDNGGAYGAAAKRRSEYNANKAALAQKQAEARELAASLDNGDAVDEATEQRVQSLYREINDLQAKIKFYEDNEYADNVWLEVYDSGEDLSAYENVTYGKNEDPIAYIAKTTVEPFEASSFNNALSADERVVYNYLLKNKGVKAAQKWLDSGAVRDTINQRIGQAEGAFINERFNSNLPKTVLASAYGIAGGIGNYANGLIAPVAATVNPTALSTPASIYANQEASKDLGFVGKALSDASVSIGNMAPSIVLGAVNPVLGQASFGVSAAGNAYNEARKEGKTVEQAALYGIVTGASEVFLQNILGGIPGISGASNKLVNAAKNLKTPALRALAVYGIDIAGEATEEYLQDILEPMFRNAIFNEDNEVKIFTGEAAYSAMLGALTSAILNIPTLSTKSTKQLGASMIQGGWYDTLLDNALKLDKDSNAFDLANKLKNGELTASEENIGELLRAYKADDGDLSFLEEKGTVEKMPNSTVTESVDNLKAETNPSELKGEALVLSLLADGEVSNSKAKKILEDPEAMKTIGADVEGLDTISKKRAVIKEAMQNYIAQNAEKIASNAQKETTAQTATNTATEAQSKDADTFQYKHFVEKQKLGTRLLSELEGRTSKTGEKLADKLTAMATSITGDEDANRAVYKLFANPRYAAAASIEDGAGFLEIIRNLKTDAGRNFARQQMSGFINNAATAATLTELLRKDVNVTLENAAGMKPSEGKSAPKGYYDETDHRVAIADNLLTYETLVGTIAHEGFHANGAIDSEIVNNFANTLKELWGNSVWEDTVKRKKAAIEAYTGKPTTTLKAEEEVCAETLTKLFNTQKAWDVMGEMFGKIEGSDRLLNRIKNSLDRFFANFKKRFKGEMPAGKLTTFRENLEHLIEETKGDVKTAKESKKEAKKEAKKETATDAELDAELEAELAEETEQNAKPEKNAAVGYKTKPTDSEAETPTETKKAPAEEDEEVELVSDLYDAEAKGGRMYSFAGENAETADVATLDVAKAMLADGVDDETVRRETGWFKGYDGKWRFEIDDSDMRIIKERILLTEADYILDEVISHDKLFEAYPELRKMKVEVRFGGNGIEGAVGAYNADTNTLTLNRAIYLRDEDLKKVILHELQHNIQRAEGFARGSNPEFWKRKGISEEDKQRFIERTQGAYEKELSKLSPEDSERVLEYYRMEKELGELLGKVDFKNLDKTEEFLNQAIAVEKQKDALEKNLREEEWFEKIDDLYKQTEQLDNLHVVFYKNTAGEIEARNAAERINLSAEERKNTRPDIDREDVVFAESGTELDYIGDTKDGRRCYKSGFGENVSESDRLKFFKERLELIFNLGAVKLKTGTKRIQIRADKFTLKENLFGDKRARSGEAKAKINSLYDLVDILSTAKYDPSATNTEASYINPNQAPKNPAHKDVKYWYKFRNEIVFDGVPYTVTFNIRDKGKEQYQYLIDFKENKTHGLSTTVAKGSNLLQAGPASYNASITPSQGVVNTPVKKSFSTPDTDITHPDIDSPSMRRDLTTLESAKDTNGDRLYNYKAMEADEEEYRKMLKKHGGLADNEIEELFNTVDAVVDRIKETIESDAELARAIDFGWERDIDDRAYSPLKQNSDKLYKVSLDFSTMCRKRILQQITQSQIQEAMDKTLDAKESIAVRQALAKLIDMGFQIEVACKLCYVESARLKSPAQIKKFLENKEQVLIEFLGGKSAKVAVKEAEAAIREKLGVGNTPLNRLDKDTADKIRDAKRKTKAEYQPSAEESKYLETIRALTRKDFTTPEGLENLAKNHYEIFNAYTSYVRNATKSKAVENDTWFRAGDTAAVGDKLIANMNTENGLRSQSWSDFQVIHLLDYIAATIELSTRGAKEQVYTKVPDFVKLMHGTNAMINLSLIPAKEYNGKLEYDKVEGMAFDIAMKLREKYPDVAGTICIGIANEQIQKLLASEDIDYVIPYHSSALNKHLRKAMDIPTWEDYQSYQGEKALSEENAKENAKAMGVELDKEKWHKAPSFSEWFDLKTAKEIAKSAKHGKYGVMTGAYMAMQNAADNYKRLCAERGLLPKFSYGKADFSNEENYWKLLIDRKMVNQETGEIIEQKPLAPKFNLDEITEIMDDAIAQYPTVSKHQDAATEVVTKLFVNGKVRGDMSAEEIYSAVEKAVLEETDNTTVYNILESAKDLDDGRMYSAEDTDIEETPFESVNEYRAELARIYREGYAEGKSAEEIEREADEFTRVHNARLAAQFGTIKQGEKPAREVEVTKRTSKEEKVSQTVRTILEAGATPDEALPTIERMIANGTFSYKPLSNKKLVEEAEQKIGTTQESFESTLKAWLAKENKVSARDIVLGWKLYDYAANHNQISTGMEILVHIQDNVRAGAQATQAARVLKMLSPEGQLYTAKKAADRLADKLEEEGKVARKRFADKDKEAVEKIRKFAKRKGEEKVGNQLDKIANGEQTEAWAGEVRSLLAESISRRIKPLNQVSMSRARGIASDLMQFAENTLPKRKGEKSTPKTAAERIRDFFANRGEYLKAWNEAKDVLKEKYAGDAESLEMLDDFFNAIVDFNGDRADTVMMRAVAEVALNKDTDIRAMMQKAELGDIKSVINEIYNKLQTVVDAKGADATLLRLAVQRWVTEKYVATHPLTQKQIDALIRKKLTQACGNINSIIRQNGTYKGEQLQQITAMLINEFGISNEAAITAAEKIEERYNFVLDRASQIALKNAVKERKPSEKKSLNELFEQYANMGAFTGDYNEAVTAKLFDREGIKVNTALAEAYLAATTEEGRKKALYAIYKDLGSQMPSTFADKEAAWRYLAMLGNLRTHVRNAFGNAVFTPVVLTKDLIGTGIEQAAEKISGGKYQATKAIPTNKLYRAAMKDAELMDDVIMSNQKYNDKVNANKAIEEGRVIFDKKWQKLFETWRKLNSGALEVEDAFFSKRHYAVALAQYCKARGISEQSILNGNIPDEARVYAIKEAKKATFRDVNEFTKLLNRLLRAPGKHWTGKAWNYVAGGVMPFVSTPANILLRGIEYGPIGLTKAIVDIGFRVKSGKITLAEAFDELSAGLTGTMLMALGMLLQSLGVVRAAGGDDEKDKEFEELWGHQAYSLVIGDTSITLDWLAPAALPFFVGVQIADLFEADGEGTVADVFSGITNVMEPMLELSCLQSLNSALDNISYSDSKLYAALVTAATSRITQYFPTLLGQTERVGENKRMQTFTNKDSWLTSDMQYLLGKISAKVPGVDYQQIPYIDAWGRIEETGNVAERALNNYVNPSYVSEVKASAMEQELQRLYEATKGEDNISVYPKRADKHFTVRRENPVTGEKESEDYYLSADEYVQYATAKGTTAYKTITAFMEGPIYNTLDDKEKARAISNLYSYAEEYARTTVTDHEPEGLTKRAMAAAEQGIDFDTFFNAYVVQSSVEADKDFLGDTVTNSASSKKIDAIDKITADPDKRLILYKELDVGVTAQNNAILDDAIDAKINGNTTAYDAAIARYIDNNKGADKKSATEDYIKRIEDIRKDLAKLSYDDPAEYEKQLEYYRSGAVAKYFTTSKMKEAKDKWLDSYTDSLARKLKKYEDDAKKTELIYAEAAKYGIKEKELKKRADKLK